MSLHVLSAGTGYLYYTSQIATGDQVREPGSKLGDYYTAEGYPPGQWTGSNLPAFGVTGTVTEQQMENLFGHGLHPDRERIITEKTAAGLSRKDAERAAKLGAKYYEYTAKDSELGRKISEATAAFERVQGRKPTAVEKRNLKVKEGAKLFLDTHGRRPSTKEELGRFITVQLRPQQTAVAGFDLTFTPVKSVSVLWALGGETGRTLVEDAHERAIQDALLYLEERGIATRTGRNGIAQEGTSGVVATSFRHHDSRLGDPNLHNHVVVSNKVQDGKGHWKTIDSKLLHRTAVAVSELYNTRTQMYLEQAGIQFEARTPEASRQPVMEIKAIPDKVVRGFARRSESMRDIVEDLVADYTDRHGRAPDKAAMLKIMQTANLQTRPDKAHAPSLAAQVAQWHHQAAGMIGKHGVKRMIEQALTSAHHAREQHGPSAGVDVAAAAEKIIAEVSDKRATWSRQNVMAEAWRWAKTHGMEHGHVDTATLDQVIDTALGTFSVSLTPASIHPTFRALAREDGTSVFVHRTDTRYTSTRVLADENLLLRAAATDVTPAATRAGFDTALEAFNARLKKSKGYTLGDDQVAFARELATSGKLLAVGIGPAGAGKTTAMELVREAVTAAGHKVIALAPSAIAAKALGQSINAVAATTDLMLTVHDKDLAGHGDYTHLDFGAGDLIIVDEGGMQGTNKLAKVITLARDKGAVVRFVGDDHQIGAVQAGGALRMLVAEAGAVELLAVQRFRTVDADGKNVVNLEEAAASLALRTPRVGEVDPFAWYKANGRIVAGDAATMEQVAFTAFQTHLNAGDDSVIIAPGNEMVDRLNERAQAYRLQTGDVDPRSRGVLMRDGAAAHTGDHVVTRLNDGRLKAKRGAESVKNGDLWRVRRTHRDGSLTVEHLGHGGRVRLPGEYVRAHVHLGYATTSTRVQGLTTVKAVSVMDATTTRNHAYVMSTRGSARNSSYVIVEVGQTRDQVLASIAANHGLEESAHEAMAAEHHRVDATATLLAQYRHVNELAEAERMAGIARHIMGRAVAETFISAESWGAVAANLARAETAGWDPRKLMATAYAQREFGTAEDTSAVLAWRIQRIVNHADRLLAKAGARPMAGFTDTQLADLGQAAEHRATLAKTALDNATKDEATSIETMSNEATRDRQSTNGQAPTGQLAAGQMSSPAQKGSGAGEPAHWTGRPYGALSDEELENRINLDRFAAREAAALNDPAEAKKMHSRIRQLRGEQAIRNQYLDYHRRATETVERGPKSRWGKDAALAGHRDRYHQSRTVAAQIRAEQRLRLHTPGPVTQVKAPDRLPEWLAPARTLLDSNYLPAQWRQELLARRAILAARFEERGHLIAAEPTPWSAGLGPVPAKDEPARRWRDLAAEVHAFRERYNIPDTETVPVPVAFRDQEIGKDLHHRVVSMSRAAHATPERANDTDLVLDAANALDTAAATHAGPSEAQEATDKDREANGQEPAAATETEKARPRLRSRLERLTAERAAARATQQQEEPGPAEDPAKRAAREQSERAAALARQQQQQQNHGREL
ncbi:MobF family relaxase [Arthrobacter sp. NyZ413]|uniref:MobF family relaxase n=1 Tax=Arthrobacter sp. NyZ413 TaxID=3144669 RepID=UPI003BF849D6